MKRVLLVTNDFPPTVGGIQSYLRDFTATLPPAAVTVFASTQDSDAARAFDAAQPYEIIRWPRRVMLPTPATARRMSEIIQRRNISTVWFGASAPLGLLARVARRAGASRVVATTHGHEVGWAMLPGARQALGRIGRYSDVVTYISDYTLNRFGRAFGDVEFAKLPSGVDTEIFHPGDAQDREETRSRYGVGDAPLVVCTSRLVARKGQDWLLQVWPEVTAKYPAARLIIVGEGPYEKTLRRLAHPLGDAALLTGRLDIDEMRALIRAADVFAMPCRTRGGGLDVEGLGIVYLEAQASGVPVIAGASGGAPETVTSESGIVVHSKAELTQAILRLLADAPLRERMGKAGRENVEKHWTWEIMGRRLQAILVP